MACDPFHTRINIFLSTKTCTAGRANSLCHLHYSKYFIQNCTQCTFLKRCSMVTVQDMIPCVESIPPGKKKKKRGTARKRNMHARKELLSIILSIDPSSALNTSTLRCSDKYTCGLFVRSACSVVGSTPQGRLKTLTIGTIHGCSVCSRAVHERDRWEVRIRELVGVTFGSRPFPSFLPPRS